MTLYGNKMNRCWVETVEGPLGVANNRWLDGSIIVTLPNPVTVPWRYLSDPTEYASYADIRRGRIVYGNDGGGTRGRCRAWTVDSMLNSVLEDCGPVEPEAVGCWSREFRDSDDFRRRLGWESYRQLRYFDYPRVLKTI